ncbi:nucleoside hydrolase [Caulobacter segnis]|uniref:Inosine/uridine-preferring nucleoside hydrolase n=2 Tax=Caulobacter segnis TaxID=88688 RepID=D5VK19_CAUST|nr:nucleoside hydrolase [Caulobacter segnis]ADG10842.1 Inosine/uridine-preferring nucleoside hydrolase [Caulobacter segnis ATCC 21756]AVQ02545.1 nucleoside hydrolase [Caulobacter segnis]
MSAPPRLVILDTDPGVDDALALLYLSARSDLKLLAITTVFGNADVETTTRNALWLRDTIGLSAPVHRGAEAPLNGPRGASPVHVHGENGLGDIDLSGPSLPAPDAGAAHARIIELVHANPGAVTLVAIGPLTNLALALRDAPDIASLVAGVTIMGGAFAQGNVTPYAEANIHNDAEAAAAVLEAPWPVTLVPLDATRSCVLSTSAARTAGGFVETITRGYAAAYAAHEGLDGCPLHDVAALVSLTVPELFTARTTAVGVGQGGERHGQTLAIADGPPVRIHVEADGAGLVEHFLRSITPRKHSTSAVSN